jgi:hypothetical protein
VSVAAEAPGVIVGHVPMMAGRYCAEGVSPPPPLLDPDPELELTLASVMSLPPPDPEVECEPELPLEPDVECEPELPLEPEVPPELELWLPEPPELVDPELLSEPLELLPPELDSPGFPVSTVGDTAQLAMSEKPVNAKLKTTVQRIAILRCGVRERIPHSAHELERASARRPAHFRP